MKNKDQKLRINKKKSKNKKNNLKKNKKKKNYSFLKENQI